MKSAWQSIKSIQPYTKSLESIFQKVDSKGNALLSPFLWLIGLTPRSFMSPLLLAPYNNFSKTNTLFTTAETMDCHADKSARNDRNNATSKKMDSSTANLESIFQNAATLSKPQAAGFLMKNWGFQGSGKGVTLAVMTAAATAESTIFRKKPTPKMPNLL
ncbi:hypothetical protein HMPREF2087_01614 [Helicobacter canis NCTC 12740]|uniref:Uncharacterized protein n=2 Tax=Helicobacter canis TaxID=29419 RepID=V8CED5_9HELI|nr:hypothetical protein HMPREF2087_01614 [Helicobacter canis NCTC 12740]